MVINRIMQTRPQILFEESSGEFPPSSTTVFRLNGYDPLNLAYTMLTSRLFASCIFLWMNHKPEKFKAGSLLPENAYMENFFTDQTIGTLKSFHIADKRNNRAGFHCVGTLDEANHTYCALSSSKQLTLFTVWHGADSEKLPKEIEESLDKLWDNYDRLVTP